MDIAFYTYFYGSNDNPAFKIPAIPSFKYKCYYISNNKAILEQVCGTHWTPIFDKQPSADDLIESNMLGKRVKACPHRYKQLKCHDYLCFLDSKLDLVSETFVEDFIVEYFIKQDYALLLREHWFIHENVWGEFCESMKQTRYLLEKDKYIKYINAQVRNGLQEKTRHHCACGFLIRNMKHEKINLLNETWYEHIKECGIQDQISFFFVKQMFADCIHPFTEIPYSLF